MRSLTIRLLAAIATVIAASSTAGCSCNDGAADGGGGEGAGSNTGADGTGGDGMGTAQFMGTGGNGQGCVNLECQQVQCPGGAKTTVSGTVFAPNGDVPLYNVVVYVPNASARPAARGRELRPVRRRRSAATRWSPRSPTPRASSCSRTCPSGNDIPLVIQVGKWRRQIVAARRVAECADNAARGRRPDPPAAQPDRGRHPEDRAHHRRRRPARVPAAQDRHRRRRVHARRRDRPRQPLRRPRRRRRSTRPRSTAAPTSRDAPDLWDRRRRRCSKYDVVLLSCEGGAEPDNKPPPRARRCSTTPRVGGRVFASHWHNYWLEAGPGAVPARRRRSTTRPISRPVHRAASTPPSPRAWRCREWLVNVGGLDDARASS